MRSVLLTLTTGLAALTAAAPARAALPPYFEDAPLHAVQFVDRTEGWAVGAEGVVWHTIDGGAAWERQPTGTRATLHALHFLTPYTGWAVGREELPNGAGSATMLYWLALPSSVPAPSGELSEFTFYTAIGDAIQVGNYGGGRRLTDDFIVLSCAGLHDEEAYRQRLLGAWRSGELVRLLAPMPQAVFYLRPEELAQLGFDPIPMLRRALTSPTLGAIDLGHLDFSVEGHR